MSHRANRPQFIAEICQITTCGQRRTRVLCTRARRIDESVLTGMSTPRWAQPWALLLLTCVTVNQVVGASHGSGTEGTRSTPHLASHMAPAPPTLTLMQLGEWLQEQQPTELRIPFSEIDVMGSKSMRSKRGPDEPKTTAISTTAICAPPYTLPLQITSGPPCNITCVVCTTDSGHTWIANASSSFNHTFDKSVGFGNPNANQTLALFDALFRVLGSMDATFTTVDCACFALTVPEAQTCTLRVAFCAYVFHQPTRERFAHLVWFQCDTLTLGKTTTQGSIVSGVRPKKQEAQQPMAHIDIIRWSRGLQVHCTYRRFREYQTLVSRSRVGHCEFRVYRSIEWVQIARRRAPDAGSRRGTYLEAIKSRRRRSRRQFSLFDFFTQLALCHDFDRDTLLRLFLTASSQQTHRNL
jgi:hypothetical protein